MEYTWDNVWQGKAGVLGVKPFSQPNSDARNQMRARSGTARNVKLSSTAILEMVTTYFWISH
jgi:hypothetical protein